MGDIETWRPVVGVSGYDVSDHGNVRSWRRSPGPRPITLHTTPKGYKVAGLCGGRLNPFVHRLVLEAFVGPCPDGMQTRHLDGDPGNNRLGNLKWGTRPENEADKNAHGKRRVGERVEHLARLTREQVVEIRRRLEAGDRPVDLALAHGVARCTIADIRYRRTWKSA